MVSDSFGNENSTTSDRRKKRLLVTVAGIAAAALLLGFVFTTATANNSSNAAYAATEGKGVKVKNSPSSREAAPIEDPPYLVPFSQAAATVEKAFPDSKINSGERLVIKTKSTPPYRPPDTATGMPGNDNNTVKPTPAYIFQLVKTDDKALYQTTVVVNGTSGEIISPQQWLNNDGICGPHDHPPGMGTHWHVCDYRPWKWTPRD
ncbi:MAG: hypothetical protein QXX64_05430 [Nitrososphaera sp.]